ncbi:acetyl-CoA acetyltransferase [Gammaproteobacteria bacterium]|nr:acetyl-CoA acetyltransferase [Gammaproteobacteria bacterium]
MNTPVVIGISSIQQKGSYDDLDEALILMEKATQKAISDSTNPNIVNYIDQIQIPKGFWKYRDPGKWIAKRNGMKSAKTTVTKIGVLQQNLINTACKDIVDGKINASLIIGGEARYKKIQALKENKVFVETELNTNPDYYVKADHDLQTQDERDELGLMAVGYYAILETAYRAQKKLSIQEHKEKISKLYEVFSKIAKENPDGWLDKSLTANEIIEASKSNPLQALPYNKFHCTSWNVNQASAIIICSENLANNLRIPSSKRVYPVASSESNHMIAPIQRPHLSKSYGLDLAVKFIKDVCRNNNIEPNLYELYSCFPIAVQMFSDSLGLNENQSKTVTGGMSFAGGPLNNYMIHSTVKMLSKIRSDHSNIGLVTGVSGMMTKQALALWSKKPLIDFITKDVTEEAKLKEAPVQMSEELEGMATIIGYTIFKDNNGELKAVIYSEDSKKKRKVLISYDKEILKSMGEEEWVGKNIKFKGKHLVL